MYWMGFLQSFAVMECLRAKYQRFVGLFHSEVDCNLICRSQILIFGRCETEILDLSLTVNFIPLVFSKFKISPFVLYSLGLIDYIQKVFHRTITPHDRADREHCLSCTLVLCTHCGAYPRSC